MTFPEAIESVACEIVVPADPGGENRGSARVIDIDKDKRRFPRFPCRVDAILRYQSGPPALRRPREWMRIMVRNLSRCGMGFLHSEAVFPGERMLIVFPRGIQRVFVAKRCRRIGARCFDVGGEFSELLDNPTEAGLR
ncbi:MAG: hypothetical protein GXX96_04280 [Planctomycetaceae bacterium]|nr:hypothetical protein [Planctomycetaceae bacterium]